METPNVFLSSRTKVLQASGEYLFIFIAIDDYSRELYVAILLDKMQFSVKKFLEQVKEAYPYTIEVYYSDN